MKLKRTIRMPHGGTLTVTLEVTDYFSVTCDERDRFGRDLSGGANHALISEHMPEVRPLIALHLADAATGSPMHAEANGFYWLAGAVGGLRQAHHGGNGSDARSAEACLLILASHLRVPLETARAMAERVAAAEKPLAEWHRLVLTMAAGWQDEANAGRALMAGLAATWERA